MGSEHYCLRWNNHQNNLLGVFNQLLQDQSLVDVTLACAEGHSIRAHKVVLSACSSYFQTLFVDHPNRHPIVILKDVRFAELRTLVEFMYKGEVNVEYCQLSALLKTAESLKVKGLAEMTNLNSGRDDRSDVSQQKHSGGVSASDVPSASDLVTKRLSDDGSGSPPEGSASSEVNPERQSLGEKENSGCDDNESCDGVERVDTPEVDDLSVRSSCPGPSDLTVPNNATSSNPPSTSTITASCSSAISRLPSPHSSEPIPGPSCLLPVQQVPLSLKKEVDWDRSTGDDKSTTGESSSDYRHPHDLDMQHMDSRYGSPCTISGSHQLGPDIQISSHSNRSSTPFQFPFPPFAGSFSGFADVTLDSISRQSSLLGLLHQQSLLDSRSPVAGLFRCSVCLASFPSSWLLEQHSELQHSAQSPPEDMADTEEKPFKCDQCGQSYRYRSAYLKHREQNHRARLPADKLFTCDVCGMQFRYLKSFKKHRLNHALEKLHSKSPSDLDVFTRAMRGNGMLGGLLTERALRVGSIPEYGNKFFSFSPTNVPTDGESTSHHNAELPEKKGDRNGTAASHPENGSNHVSSSNEAISHKMAEDDVSTTSNFEKIAGASGAEHKNFYKFSLDDYYYNRRGTVTGGGDSLLDGSVVKMEKADQDETVDSLTVALSRTAREASLLSLLRADAAERQRERRFACPFCGKCVRSKENLKLHVRKHTGERPFVCLFCGRAFGGKSDLTRHLRIHTGERPYHCEMCGKCFARADYLSKHLTTHIHNSQR